MRPPRLKEPTAISVNLTTFDSRERFDEKAYRAHLRRMVEAGIGVYLGGGGSGEAFTLTPQETRRLYEISAEELNGKVPSRVMGVEPRTAQGIVDLYQAVKPMGFDAMQIFSLDAGHFYHPDNAELERYFRDILEVVKMPAVLSTHFSVGYMIPLELIDKLVTEYDQVVGVDCTALDTRYLIQLIDLVGDRVDVMVGGPMMGFQCLALGGLGMVLSEGNLAPKLCMAIHKAYDAGDTRRASQAYAKLLRLYDGFAPYGSIRGIKAALNMLGLPGGYPRRPRLPVSKESEQKIAKLLERLDIRGEEGLR